jgi:hypothetical protein
MLKEMLKAVETKEEHDKQVQIMYKLAKTGELSRLHRTQKKMVSL